MRSNSIVRFDVELYLLYKVAAGCHHVVKLKKPYADFGLVNDK